MPFDPMILIVWFIYIDEEAILLFDIEQPPSKDNNNQLNKPKNDWAGKLPLSLLSLMIQ
jgi:hypothetical protein